MVKISTASVGVRIKNRPRMEWAVEGNCYLPPTTPLEDRAAHTAQFFPTQQSTPRQIATAKAICVGCPVRSDCLAYAIGWWERGGGIFGGETETERRITRKAWRATGEISGMSLVEWADGWIAMEPEQRKVVVEMVKEMDEDVEPEEGEASW